MKATSKIIRIRLWRKSLILRALWFEVYEKELAKPQWACDDAAYGQKMHETYAKRSADIATNNAVWGLK